MPVVRFLRLLVTLLVLVSGPRSALASGVGARVAVVVEGDVAGRVLAVAGGSHGRSADEAEPRGRLAVTHVGESATFAFFSTLRSAARGRGGLFAILSHALGDTAGDENDEVDVGDAPDRVNDECQDFAIASFSGFALAPLATPYVEPNLWGIRSSTGHPHGVDEPPRI